MTTSRRRTFAFAMVASVAITVAACTPLTRNHGYVPPEDELSQVVVGKTTQAELEGLIGKPGSQGVLTGSAWYYVGSTWNTYGAFQPREVRREVLAISFDQQGAVANVERFGMERGRVVALSRRVTDSGVTGVTLAGQILGNLGNFDAGSIIDAE